MEKQIQRTTCDTMGCTATETHEVFDGYRTLNLCDVHAALLQLGGKLSYVARTAVALHDMGEFTLDLDKRGKVSRERLLRVCELAADAIEFRRANLVEAATLEERFLRDD